MSGDGSKGNSFKKEGEQAARSTAVEEELQLSQQSQLAAERAADLPLTPHASEPARVDDGRHCAGGTNPP
jgi:hypothetical protein